MKHLKWVFQALLIGLLVAGCISPASLQTIESTPQSTEEPPGVTSSPAHLPEDNPAETPRPGWTVYTDPRLDIIFQLPAAWQRVERNGAAHQFEGPSGYVSFSNSLTPTIFNENVEKICQKEIELGNKKYQSLDQKPFGEHPQVINVQVDYQPACLILPSTDQDNHFERHSILYARYTTDLALKPEQPRFLTIEADKDHIQSIAETVHFTTKEASQPVEHLHLPNASPSFQTAPSSTPIAGLPPNLSSGQVLPADFTLDDPTFQSILKSYLARNIGFATYGGKTYCAYEPLAGPQGEPDGATVQVYLWALCQEYYRDGQGLQKGTGVSLPVAIELVKAPGGYQFNSYKVPGDGSLFPKDVRAEFPPSTWEEIWPTSQEEVEAANARIQQLEAETKAEADKEFAAASQLTPSTSTLLEPTSTPLPTPSLASVETPGNAPEQDARASQIESIDALRALFDLPQLPLEFVEMTTMINSPNGDLAVALYQDKEGRQYSVVPGSDQVVEIDARAVLASISPQAPPLPQEALRAKAEGFVRAAIPDFESMQAGLAYEAGVKGDNYFFDWRATNSPGAMMPPFVQIGLYKSGELFAYYNTLNQSVKNGATLSGQVIAGYGDHRPIGGLPLRLRQKGDGSWDTTTDGNGNFTLTGLPLGGVIVEDDHLIFQVTIDSPSQSVDLGKLKYPLIHPPDYYWWQAAPLADPGQLLRDGKTVVFEVCAADSNWVRPDPETQREQVYARLPFSELNKDRFIKFERAAMLYDTVDVTQQSYPGGLNLDEVGADWLYLTGLWTASKNPLTNSNCSYAPGDLGSLFERSQLEIWLFGYRATGVQELDKGDAGFAAGALCDASERNCTVRPAYHYAVNVLPAPGFQIIRFAGEQDVVAIHIVESGKEILALP